MKTIKSIKKMVSLTDFSEKENNKFTSERTVKLLLEMSIGCLALVIIRAARSHNLSYLFLIWNLFLAWVPFLITRYLINESPFKIKKTKNVIAFILWVAFLPNAPYILTDLFHLHVTGKVPMWYDLIVILSFALTGMVLFYLSFLEFEKKLYPSLHYKFIRWIRVCFFLAVGYGIYLGRFLRFNSWDILSDPGKLFHGMYFSLFNIGNARETFAITFFFSVFLYYGYKLFFLFADHSILKSNCNENYSKLQSSD